MGLLIVHVAQIVYKLSFLIKNKTRTFYVKRRLQLNEKIRSPFAQVNRKIKGMK